MPKSLAIIGAGRVGRTLGRSLRESGWKIILVSARTESTAKRAARFIGGGRPTIGLPSALGGAEAILLTVPDDAIAPVAADLARMIGAGLRGRIVLHTSGALDASVLQPLQRRGATTGSMHPLQTFTGVNVPPLAGKVFAIEGDQQAVRTARAMARTLGGVPVTLSAANKALYHAAGAFGAGLVLALEESGAQLLKQAGFQHRRAQRALLSLTRQVLEHYEKLGAQKAWTGPLSRGDYGVVAAHRIALRKAPPEFLAAYEAVSRLAARVLSNTPRAMIRELNSISQNPKTAKAKRG
jgi:predicted short-subunit dehydrogenase-like oxidoreductase (DUF2520 family)